MGDRVAAVENVAEVGVEGFFVRRQRFIRGELGEHFSDIDASCHSRFAKHDYVLSFAKARKAGYEVVDNVFDLSGCPNQATNRVKG